MSSEKPSGPSEDGVLILTNDDIKGILEMPAYIEALDAAYRELGENSAQNMARRRLFTPLGEPYRYHWYNVIAGVVPGARTAALRVNSGPIQFETVLGNKRMTFPGGLVGLVHLFDTETGAARAIIHDFYINPIRVAGTSAVGVKYMARPDSKTMALLGTGWQARWHISALLHVRPFKQVRVFSPNKEHRDRFVAQQRERFPNTGFESSPNAEKAVRDADVVIAATNSITPVMKGEWLAPGCHVISISGADRLDHRQEIDAETVSRSSFIVVNSKEQLEADEQSDLLPLVKTGQVRMNQIFELAELSAGKVQSAVGPKDIRFHFNNTGMGIQFAAVGAQMLKTAIARGVGTRLPYTWRGRFV